MNAEYQNMIRSLADSQSAIYNADAEYGGKYNELARRRLQDTVTGTNGVAGIGQLYSGALRSADPNAARLTDTLTATANNDLALGANVDPALLRIAQQSVRGRTLGTLGSKGKAGDYSEALGVSAFANDLRNQRRGFAQQVSAANDNRYAGAAPAALGISGISTSNLVTPAASTALLNSAYGENQANNRAQSQLETQVGMKQADIWNGWMSMAAGAI